ncbi:hypothetical protein [Oscillatoria acuminata]|uniref:hypothetical protein n=1 Tax=Oscillatoria acuminata TaxID=118323 RepID=UPI0012EAEF36|nr:hypothetical protein [Oscillatoria acuminata]
MNPNRAIAIVSGAIVKPNFGHIPAMTPLGEFHKGLHYQSGCHRGFSLWEFARLVKMFTPEIFFREKINPNFANRSPLPKPHPTSDLTSSPDPAIGHQIGLPRVPNKHEG